MSRAVIAGIGHTAFGKLPGRDVLDLTVEATRNALADANIEKERIDGIFVKNPTSQFESMHAQRVAEALGLQPLICGGWDQGGASNISLIMFATMAIAAGQCEVALVCFADNPRTGTRAAYKKMRDFSSPYGFAGVAASFGMIARCHMDEYGTTHEQLGAIAMACRRHGAANPRAQLREALTLHDYLASPFVVEPLRKADCCLISDGGAAVIIMSEAKAKALKIAAPVPILAFGQGQTSWEVPLRPRLTDTAVSKAAATAFRNAGLKPTDIDVAELYDCFTITALMTLEDYGFCRKGEGGRFVQEEGVEIGGALPLNTSGGLLSETGMPGLQLVIEAVRQMRGTANLQVPNAKKAIVSGQGGAMQTHSTMILGQ